MTAASLEWNGISFMYIEHVIHGSFCQFVEVCHFIVLDCGRCELHLEWLHHSDLIANWIETGL